MPGKKSTFFVTLLCMGIIAQGNDEPWTSAYQKVFNFSQSKLKSFVLSSKKEGFKVIPFKQLLFSWNACRPKKGFFRFYGRVRDGKTKKWLAWHKMVEWGASVQQSFRDTSGTGSYYEYVRLELDPGYLADGFEIKVEAHEGAHLSDFKFMAICVSRPADMPAENADEFNASRSIFIRGVPRRSQWRVAHADDFRICSPTSMSMVVGYFNAKPVNTADFANRSYDEGLKVFGSWPFNTAHAFEECEKNIYFFVMRLPCFSALYNLLAKDTPVVVSVRGELRGARKAFSHGHLIVVVGYDAQNKKVICHDPAFKWSYEVLHAYDLDAFLAAWDRSYHTAYVSQRADHVER